MRLLGLLLVLTSAGRDTSPRGGSADPRRFSLMRKVPLARANLVSPAGGRIAQYSGNNVVVYDVLKKESVTLAGHTQNLHDGGWSRNGRILATSAYDGTVRAWDVEKGRELMSVSPHAGYA